MNNFNNKNKNNNKNPFFSIKTQTDNNTISTIQMVLFEMVLSVIQDI